MAKSLAFWLEGSKKENTSIELHFNFWRLNMGSKKEEINYLDVGVKFKCLENIDSIKIFFPFKITKDNYVDSLGRTLSENKELIAAIFNARVDSLKTVSQNVVDICFVNNKKDTLRVFSQIELSEQGSSNGVNITHQDGGSILSFPKNLIICSTNGKNDDIFGYFRFRIKLNSEDKKSISQLYVSKDAKFLSRMESIEIVDFRVNEVRNLPQKIVSCLSNDSCITSVHFFLIRETNSEHKLSHSEFKRCRILEKNLWDSYLSVPSDISIPDQMLIYHWKEPLQKLDEQKYLDNFSAFAKFSTITVTWGTVCFFLGFLLIWGAFSGVLGNALYSIPSRFADAPTESTCHNENTNILMDNKTKFESPQPRKPQ
ncbi:MAG: hypothetical protein NTV43_07360 [Methylococcales bacterium]|nr:hypothetical protein [Methylococcales bacterium]